MRGFRWVSVVVFDYKNPFGVLLWGAASVKNLVKKMCPGVGVLVVLGGICRLPGSQCISQKS